MTRRHTYIGYLLLLAIFSCGDRTVGEGETIVGDWFECDDLACKKIEDDGMRFNADGTLNELDAPGGTLDPGEQYCLGTKGVAGTYTWDGETLTLMMGKGGQPMSVGLVVEGDRATYGQQTGALQYGALIRINPPRLSGPCP